jgi:hypothetical protein
MLSVPPAAEAPQIALSISPVVNQMISTPEIISATGLPDQTDRQNNKPLFAQPLFKEPFTWTFNADLYLATRFDNQSAYAFSSPFSMIDRLKDSVYGELADSLAKARKQSPPALTGNQSTHSLALQSVIREFQHNFTTEQEDSDLLVGNHFRKQYKLVKKAVDEFHSQLVACD